MVYAMKLKLWIWFQLFVMQILLFICSNLGGVFCYDPVSLFIGHDKIH